MSPSLRTLLIVEDDPGLQSQLRWSFEDYNAVTAVDQPAALAAMRRQDRKSVV